MRFKKYLLACLVIGEIFFSSNTSAQIYVSLTGSDTNPGTKDKPLATVAIALRHARELRRLNDPSIKTGIHIYIGGGTYQFNEPLFIRPEDSGTEKSPTIIQNESNDLPIFSGGTEIKGWKKVTENILGLPNSVKGKVWVADAPMVGGRLLEFRQLWVNGKKATRARDKNADSMYRILSWDHTNESCWIPWKSKTDLSKIEGMEMFIHQWWAIAILRIKSFRIHGDSAQLTFHQPESRIQSEHPWPAPWISKKTGNSAFYLSNAIQFLDQPGEWFLDMKNQKVYYWPAELFDPRNANVTAPVLETLVKMEGTIDNPVSFVLFNQISFEYTSWLRPSQAGHVPHQAGMYMLDAYKLKIPGTPDKKGLENQAWIGRPAAAVEVTYANHTAFTGCNFQHMASTGLDYRKGSTGAFIIGNIFKDIGGTGIQIGVFSDEAVETHLPYNPKDERELCSNETISNNLVTDVGNEDWGCIGISAGYVKGIRIDNNEICNVPYTGISVGWGWTKSANAMANNKIMANKIHHYAKHMYDVAAIYTLSAQPGSLISKNYIDSIYKAPYAHDPNHWFYLYTDEGSSGITVKDNWCPSEKFLQNANGPGNLWENNGPGVSESIKSNAGLQETFLKLLQEKTADKNWPINHASAGKLRNQLLVEISIKDVNNSIRNKLTDICKRNGVSTSFYQWNDHLVIYDTIPEPANFRQELLSAFPGYDVRFYDDMVYEFTRLGCSDLSVSKGWENIILTANLVADPVMQNEYIEYHKTQFEKWPEVSRGFCNAEFQQLVVLKHGRQLMLVISIPKGKKLDELNPKTTLNNPRVDEWNAVMKKYQEGIEGTKKGEVWVFLKKN